MTALSPDTLANTLLEIDRKLVFREYPDSRIPIDLDRALFDVLEKCTLLDSEGIDVMGAVVDDDMTDLLKSFGERMASLCVRENNLRRSFIGLFAVTLTFYKPPDYRDLLRTMVVIYNSIIKIGESPEGVIDRIVEIVPKAAATYQDFLARDPKSNTLEAMRYVETEGPDGFLYKKKMLWER